MNTLSDDPDEEKKLMFGMLYSLKELTSKISPSDGDQGLHIMKTDSYALHHFESVTGMIFILNTDAGTPGKLKYTPSQPSTAYKTKQNKTKQNKTKQYKYLIRFFTFLQTLMHCAFLLFLSLLCIYTPDMYYNLQHIYNNIYVESTIRNPLYRHKPGEMIDSPLFEKKLEEYIKTFQ